MTHTYQLKGMTCTSCEAKVKNSLLSFPDITAVEVSKDNSTATITMEKHISLNTLQQALTKAGEKYHIATLEHSEAAEETKSWLATYKPILIIFAYITTISLITSQMNNQIHWMHFMNSFMAGFFLTFSFFKMLNLKAFAESYAMYDVIAKRFKQWGYIYAFTELALGIAYILNFNPFITNLAALIVMSVSIIGVLQSVLNKTKIQCACLGTVFQLPMSTVTIIEDALMIVMSATMLMIM